MYPPVHARLHPDRPAFILAHSGATLSYAGLDRRSNQLAHAFRAAGLVVDDTVAVVAENVLEWAEVIWATQRMGLCIAPVQRHLSGALLRGVFADTSARAIITTARHADAVRDALGPDFPDVLRLCIGGAPGFDDYARTLVGQPDDQLPDEMLGSRMMFSSGTTGRPKGIRHPRLEVHPADAPLHLGRFTDLFGFAADTVYLSPAPTYHTSPFRFVIAVQQLGGTVVCQEFFDPEAALSAIERYRVTHAQFVPTMLTRMLQLPAVVRSRYDTSSLQVAITGAAPCPPDLKRRITAWWGPVLHELYGASESYGNCHIGPQDALARPGSVGRALAGQIHILAVDSPDSADLPVGEVGQIWFAGTQSFSYLGDAEKNHAARNAQGWSTVGDLGRLDADGFLYVVGRRDHVFISGGVNVHPQLIEDRLAEHHAVADVAVVGVADPDLGQRVHAIVVTVDRAAAGEELAEQLLAFAAQGVPGPMRPRSVEFVAALPRGENGKLYKRQLSPKPE